MIDEFNRGEFFAQEELKSLLKNGYKFVHYNGSVFKIGFKNIDASFLVDDNDCKALTELKGERWCIQSERLISKTLFYALKIKLWNSFSVHFTVTRDAICRKENIVILRDILDHYFRKIPSNMAPKKDILDFIENNVDFDNYTWRDLTSLGIYKRICAGKNQFNTYSYFLKNGEVDDISLYGLTSIKSYIEFVKKRAEEDLSFLSLARSMYSMYVDFKPVTLYRSWVDLFGYDCKYLQLHPAKNLIFEKYLYSQLMNVSLGFSDAITLSGSQVEKNYDSDLRWLLDLSVRKEVDSHKTVYSLELERSVDSLTIYFRHDLGISLIFIFKEVFTNYDKIECFGHKSKFEFRFIHNNLSIKHEDI